MKAGAIKCPGSQLYFDHDSSGCVQCSKIKFYYEEFQPLLHQLKKIMEIRVCGLITFLNTWVKCENSPDDDTLFGLFSKLNIVNDSTLKNTKQTNTKFKKHLKKVVASCSSNVKTFFNKYHYCFYTGAKIEEVSDEKIELSKAEGDHFETPVKRKSKTITKSCKRKASCDKLPTKGSLKRRRLLQENISKRDKNYTDDIFDERTFYSLNDVDEMSSSSSDYSGIVTPTWNFSLSPRGPSPTPSEEPPFPIDISVEKLKVTRKNAEVYQHRRRKKRKTDKKESKVKNTPVVTAKELGASCSYSMANIYKLGNSLKEEDDYDSDEVQDDYYANLSDFEA